LVESRQLLALGEPKKINIDKCTVVGRLNPFAEKLCGSIKFRAAQSHSQSLPFGRWRGYDREPCASFGDRHPAGKWREMFITQPPCIHVHIDVYTLYEESCYSSDRGSQEPMGYREVAQTVNHGFDLERDDGVKLGDLYDYIYSQRFYYPLSIRTTIRKYASGHMELPDRTLCVVHNGIIRLPEQSPHVPDDDCDAFGGNSDDYVDSGSWASKREPVVFERWWEHPCEDDYFFLHELSEFDSEEEGDGELDDGADGHGGNGDGEEEDDDDSECRYLSLRAPRVNAYMSLRNGTEGRDPGLEGIHGSAET
jgi:hypothetical protein